MVVGGWGGRDLQRQLTSGGIGQWAAAGEVWGGERRG